MQQLPDSARIPASLLNAGRPTLPATFTEVSYSAPAGSAGEEESGGLVEYWHILRRRKGTLILLAGIGAVIGFLVTVPQTPIFQARTSLEVVSLNQNFLNMKENSPTEADTEDILTQIKILQSTSLLKRVMDRLQTGELPAAEPTRIDAWRKALNLPAPKQDPREAALDRARSSLKVRNAQDTRIIEITVDSPNPQTAALFANTLTSEFIDQSIEARWKTSEHTGEWLSRQLDDMRARLETSEDKLQRYASQAGLMFTNSDKTNVSEERLSQVQQALSAAQTDRIVKQSRLEMAESSPPDALPDILNDPTLRDYDAKLTELNRQLAELRTIYNDDYSKVQRVSAQIQPIQAAREQARTDIKRRIRNEYEEAVRKEKLLEADYTSQRSVVTGEGEKSIQYNILKGEVESNRQLYDTMLQQLKQSSLASALRASNIRVVDPAEAPVRPYRPDVPISVGIGLVSGLLLGSAFVIMRERADRSIQEPGETPLFLHLPELGIIPTDDASAKLQLRFGANKTLESANGRNRSSATGAPSQRADLAVLNRKPSVVAESFRATLVSILFSGENGSRPRVMVITSSSPAEGKSTVVSNLGVAIAEVNQKTLLIDADLRKPRLHDIFNLKNEKGLSDMLRSKDPVATLLEGAIQETSVPDLYVLSSGPCTNAATSLLYSSRMPELIRMLRTEFETILIDTPPMLHIPDARVLGRMVDSVIMVVRAAKTTRAAAVAARQRFLEDGTEMLGTILNDWNPKSSPNGYYGKYTGYGSSYGYGEGYFSKRKGDE
jgi:polysaccharide biosynthesis transport protein